MTQSTSPNDRLIADARQAIEQGRPADARPLVIAVGYPDFLAVMNTIISKTSHSIQGVAIILGVYLAINLTLSALANAYNRRIALVER